ncbi:hypothetical protein, partial [Pseudomonas japonica]|uniref:hypothetical protein n=1 Tax=Pseudomonas japonica TaxID=256466 RepID=UPI003A8699F4
LDFKSYQDRLTKPANRRFDALGDASVRYPEFRVFETGARQVLRGVRKTPRHETRHRHFVAPTKKPRQIVSVRGFVCTHHAPTACSA